MSLNFRHRRSEEPEINLIPFIDVLLVILIFLMLTTTYSKFTELKINLPVADAERQREYPKENEQTRATFAYIYQHDNNVTDRGVPYLPATWGLPRFPAPVPRNTWYGVTSGPTPDAEQIDAHVATARFVHEFTNDIKLTNTTRYVNVDRMNRSTEPNNFNPAPGQNLATYVFNPRRRWNETANELFRSAMKRNEIVYYNGHAFYGSLTVLDEPTAYPADTYQIIFMDACWSYAYYTKQVFRNKATEADPLGWALVDVVNNTEPGITGSETTAAILYDNLFKGAATVRRGGDASLYSWNNMIKYMNEHAQRRADARGENNPEIYGVSGVRTNAFKP